MAEVLKGWGKAVGRLADEIKARAERTREKPFVVMIHAPGPHHGKTTLQAALLEALFQRGMIGSGSRKETRPLTEEQRGLPVFFLQQGAPVHGDSTIRSAERLFNHATGLKAGMHVFVHNPRDGFDASKIAKHVDFIVENPRAKPKTFDP